MLTTDVENYPGFPEGVMGPELMMRFREQAVRFEADVRTEKVTKVDLSERPFKVWVGDPDAPEPTYLGESIIVSTGANPRCWASARRPDRPRCLDLRDLRRFLSGAITSWWSAAATPPSRRPCSCPSSPTR